MPAKNELSQMNLDASRAACLPGHVEAVASSTFDQVLNSYVDGLRNADMRAVASAIAENIIHISLEGRVVHTRLQVLRLHELWFNQVNREWSGTIQEKESNNSWGYAIIEHWFTDSDASGNIFFNVECYLTLIFNRSNKNWKLVFMQNSMIPHQTDTLFAGKI